MPTRSVDHYNILMVTTIVGITAKHQHCWQSENGYNSVYLNISIDRALHEESQSVPLMVCLVSAVLTKLLDQHTWLQEAVWAEQCTAGKQ